MNTLSFDSSSFVAIQQSWYFDRQKSLSQKKEYT